MAKLIPLRKLIASPKKYGILDAHKLYIDYRPEVKTTIFEASKTGYVQDQMLKTAVYLEWHPIIHNGIPYLVSEETAHKLFISGTKASMMVGELLFEKGKELYSNSVMKVEGGFMTASMTFSLPDCLKDIKQEYLLASEPAQIGAYFRLEYMDKYMDLRSFEYERNKCFAVRPYVRLKKGTMVYFDKEAFYNGTTPERAIRISLENKTSKSK